MTTLSPPRNDWPLLSAAAGILLLNMGARQSLGLFVSPLHDAQGISLLGVSFAFAVSQLVWGAVQPLFGALAERWGTFRIIILGVALVVIGTALTPFAKNSATLTLTLGIVAAAGAGAGSFAILIGWLARYLPEQRRPLAAGIINAGSSLGQFLFAPLTQWLIDTLGYTHALWVLAASAGLVLPLAAMLRRALGETVRLTANDHGGLRGQLNVAFRDPNYLLIHAGFFTCGFHIGFLATHLPGEVALCQLTPTVSAHAFALIGLFNIVGSLSAGWLCQRFRMKFILAAMYASRTVAILIFVFSPKAPLTFYLFSAALGLTWLATVPPTSGLVGKLFGPRYLATLFGMALLTHQIGGFFGAWLGGMTISQFGDFRWMWYADALLALGAALIHLPIHERKMREAVA